MLTDDEIKSKLRVALNEGSSDHARSEAAASLAAHVLIALREIASSLEARRVAKG